MMVVREPEVFVVEALPEPVVDAAEEAEVTEEEKEDSVLVGASSLVLTLEVAELEPVEEDEEEEELE